MDSQVEASDAAAPPRIWASDSKVTFEAGVSWMAEHRVTDAHVRFQAGRAKLYPEGSTLEGDEVPTCQRCCAKKGANVTLGFTPANGSGDPAATEYTPSGTCVVRFDYCRSHCNSSRLHLGGRVVIVVDVLDSRGDVVARPHTQPLMLCSKPTPRTSPVEPVMEPQAPLADNSQFALSDAAAAAPTSVAEGSIARRLAELEATLYGQLLNVQIAKLLFQ
eukprot:m51a1_g14019 hypothetical protein (219) ;mRNA; r:1105202-1106075